MLVASLMPRKGVWQAPLDALAARHPEHRFILDPEEAGARLKEVDVLLASGLPDLGFLPDSRLKAIFLPLTGVNHIPVASLSARGVRIFNCHGNADYVAERALAMTLAFLGRIIPYHEDLREGKWHGFWVGRGAEDQWDSLFGRKVCIFGAGAIGMALASLLRPFRCEITAYRRRPEAGLPAGFDRVETDFRAAVAGAELLFVALPLTPETRGLFSREILLGARDKFLVNVGRGDIVDEEGLYLSLKEGILKGAAIDTWYTYPQGGATTGEPSRYPIRSLDNVVLSPHVAGSTREAAMEVAQETLAGLEAWLSTGRAPNEVDPARDY